MEQIGRKELFSSDWLASTPYYYNTKTKKHSHFFNEVVDFTDVDIDEAGAGAYLAAGFSVCGQTPLRNIRFVRPHSTLYELEDGSFYEEQQPDPILAIINDKYSEEEVFELLREKIRQWERSHPDTILIPTSGGYDSRLLNFFVEDKERIRSITYGISFDQKESSEVCNARELSNRLGTRWSRMELGRYHHFLDDWCALYGASTHAHGMYHMEFYANFLNMEPGAYNLLSGLGGDTLSMLQIPPITPDTAEAIWCSGISLDEQWHGITDRTLIEEYYRENAKKLKDHRIRLIESRRFKFHLLTYQLRLPKTLGMGAYSPYLDMEYAMAAVNLPERRRANRVWQTEFLIRNNIYISEGSGENVLDLYAAAKGPLVPLSLGKFSSLITEEGLEAVNTFACDSRLYELALHKKDLPPSVMHKIIRSGLASIEVSSRDEISRTVMQTLYNAYVMLYPFHHLASIMCKGGATPAMNGEALKEKARMLESGS